MQQVSFLYPYDSAFRLLQNIARRKGYVMEAADNKEGIIRAHSRNFLFRRGKNLDIKLQRVDDNITNIKLMINNNEHVFEKPSSENEVEEQRLVETIYRHF